MTLNRFITPLIAAMLTLTACEGAEEDPAVEGIRSEDAGTLADDSVRALAPTPGALTPINRSEVRGRAEAVSEGDGLVVSVEAEGLEPGAEYAVTLHEGRCADGGPAPLPVGPIVADAEGGGALRVRMESDRVPDGPERFVQVHAADDRPVACADLGGDAGS